MKTEQILNLDCRKEENKQIIQKVLKQIKPLSKYSDEIPLWAIEKAIATMSKKYFMRIREIVPDIKANEQKLLWRATIINETNLEMYNVYGIEFYEVMAKCVIVMYSMVKKEIKKR